MGKPLTIQEDDDRRLEALKKPLGAKTKVEVLRTALNLLDGELERQKRVRRWRRAASLVAVESRRINKEFQKQSLLKKV